MSDIPRAGIGRLLRAIGRTRQHFAAVVVLCAGLAISAALFAVLRNHEFDRIHREFDQFSQDRVLALHKTLEFDFLEMRSLKSFFSGSKDLNREEFGIFVVPLLENHPSIRALQWAPRVPEPMRSEYCRMAARNGCIGFRFVEYGSAGILVPVSQREDYYPIYFIEPHHRYFPAMGFDLATNRACHKAMRRACDTGQIVMTSKIAMPLKQDDRAGVWAFLPVYQKHTSTDTVETRRNRLDGFVVAVLCVEGIVEEGLSALMSAGIDIQLTDDTNPAHAETLCVYTSPAGRPHGAFDGVGAKPQRESALSFSKTQDVAGRRWTITCTATPYFIQARTTWYAWSAGIAGLLLTGLLVAYLVGIAVHNAKTTRLAVQLSKTNRQLEKEVDDREQAEQNQARSLIRLARVNQLQEELLLPSPIEDKFQKIAAMAVELMELDFCRIWMVKPSDLCNRGCIHAATSDGPHVCRRRDECLHLMASSGRYTHIDGDHRRVPFGAYKIGRIASGQDNKFLTNDATTDPRVHNHKWAKELGLVSFAGYKLRDANGNPIGVMAMFSRRPVSEEDDAFLSNLVETTSRAILDCKAAEELRKSRAEAIEANQAKSRFLATMSHEIRTPMTAILGYADLLTDQTLNPSSRNNYVAVIRRSGEHLLALINDILDLSKIEAGKMTLEARRCSVVSLLADVASMVRPKAEQCGVSLSVEYAGEMPETILTDGKRLRQAIINLAGNAVKFTEKGSVRIVASFLADWRDGKPALRIEVIDTGIGIRAEDLSRIFRPFEQGDASISRKFGGTGLGLAVSQHIAALLGGELTASSVWGQGSTFTLTVPTGSLDGIAMLQRPAEIERETADAACNSSFDDLKGVRILLAEDGYDNRELITVILHNAGAEVETAENGYIAVEKAKCELFDLILMDINMPQMDGYEAARLLRDSGCEIPILALTANAMSGDGELCLQAGCNEHLAKPIDRRLLIQTIAAYVGKKAAADCRPEQSEGYGVNSEEILRFAQDDRHAQDDKRQDMPFHNEDAIVSQFADDSDMAEIIGQFVARLAEHLDAMCRALADGAFEELRRQAHTLKGAGGSYGYPMMTEACKAMEEAAKREDAPAAGAALDAVARLIHAIQSGHSTTVTALQTP